MAESIDPLSHILVPKFKILTEEEKKALLQEYNVSKKQLPRILSKDVIIKQIKAQAGDIIKITRKSPTTDETDFYRVVVNAK